MNFDGALAALITPDLLLRNITPSSGLDARTILTYFTDDLLYEYNTSLFI